MSSLDGYQNLFPPLRTTDLSCFKRVFDLCHNDNDSPRLQFLDILGLYNFQELKHNGLNHNFLTVVAELLLPLLEPPRRCHYLQQIHLHERIDLPGCL
jgi:hypothetical protein